MIKTLGYVALFAAIQTAAFVLALMGVPICALCAYVLPGRVVKSPVTRLPMLTFPGWAWLWANDEDGVYPTWYARVNPTWSMSRVSFVWTALRNPVNNLRFVRGVSVKGRPLWRKTWGAKPGGFYVSAGWNGSGWPVLSLGRNFNAY